MNETYKFHAHKLPRIQEPLDSRKRGKPKPVKHTPCQEINSDLIWTQICFWLRLSEFFCYGLLSRLFLFILTPIGSSVHRTIACTTMYETNLHNIFLLHLLFLKSHGFFLYSSFSLLFLFFWHRPISRNNFLQFCLSSSTYLRCFILPHFLQYCYWPVLKVEPYLTALYSIHFPKILFFHLYITLSYIQNSPFQY